MNNDNIQNINEQQTDEKYVHIVFTNGSLITTVDNGMIQYLIDTPEAPKVLLVENVAQHYKKTLINWSNVLYVEEV